MDPQKIKLLIVDDEHEVGDIMRHHFKEKGYQVTLLESAELALERLKAQSFHVVFLDINMPGMDGLELLGKIKQTRGECIAIMATAEAKTSKMLNAYSYGAFDYILKPFGDFSEIDEVLAAACHRVQRWQHVVKQQALMGA